MGCNPVLSAASGPPEARILFVGEAPGRLGAGRTGKPFSGDVSGDRLERLLQAAGLVRDSVFVTNAVLCLPLDSAGRNRTPRSREVAACNQWLNETILSVNPSMVVAMGRVALESIRRIEIHGLELSDAGSTPVAWHGRALATVYHPGARSQVHRPWEQQLNDWAHLGRWVMEAGNEMRTLRS
jgi:uracil-DNA glycosylase family 4